MTLLCIYLYCLVSPLSCSAFPRTFAKVALSIFAHSYLRVEGIKNLNFVNAGKGAFDEGKNKRMKNHLFLIGRAI